MSEIIEGLVSTIIPVFNRPKLVREAIYSVLGQSYRPIEIIVVDDGSTDETPQVLNNIKGQTGGVIEVIHQTNKGPGVAREAGRQVAKGEFIQYLDSDDLLLSRKFEMQVTGLQMDVDAGVAYGKTRRYRRGSEVVGVAWKRTGERIRKMFPAFLESRWWGTSTPLYRRTVTDTAGPWLPLWNEEDWEYDCRIAAMGTSLFYCEEFVSEQRWDEQPRLSEKGNVDPNKLADRSKAHRLILASAMRYGISLESPEMQHFARELFLLSRQCGTAGLSRESRELFRLAQSASLPERRAGVDFRVYGSVARLLGWRFAARLAGGLDAVRRAF